MIQYTELENLKKWAQMSIKEIQNGSGVKRDHFPDKMIAEVARDEWYTPLFSYGMEYGYLVAMVDLIEKINERAY